MPMHLGCFIGSRQQPEPNPEGGMLAFFVSFAVAGIVILPRTLYFLVNARRDRVRIGLNYDVAPSSFKEASIAAGKLILLGQKRGKNGKDITVDFSHINVMIWRILHTVRSTGAEIVVRLDADNVEAIRALLSKNRDMFVDVLDNNVFKIRLRDYMLWKFAIIFAAGI